MAHDFELVEERTISELNTLGRLYRHRTGAQLLSMVNEDENKVFGITFRTPPTDSTGVAHILEHAVLNGSRKYPVKEPFVELIKGSLKTFLNAFTYPDRTCYPVASQNVQDFYNLVDVYLDAVFHPRLTPLVLKQEGWHYELEDPKDPLVYKGVVFNEMKGSNSSPDRVMAELVQQSLFPDNTYGVDSGGHPRAIPDLTYEQFESFHHRLYQPSNARIYFYGDDDPDHRLDLLEEYLGEFEPGFESGVVDSSIGVQPRFTGPRELEETYAAGEEGEANKNMVAVNWLLEDGIDVDTGLALQILDYILIGTPASPLRKALIDSGLGEDLTGTGMESELRQFFFSTGLRGVDTDRIDEVKRLVPDILARLASDGIDAATIEAAINTTEFRLRENNTGSYPRGLVLMLRALTTWIYDRDPFEPLFLAAPLGALKERVATHDGYFEGLIRLHLLDNPHRTTLVLRPDTAQAQREEQEEKARLEQARSAMDEAGLERLVVETQELIRRQEEPDSPEALATLPRLQLSDLQRDIRTIPLDVVEAGEAAACTTYYHDLFTNGIAYVDLSFDLHTVPQELLPYLSLFGRSLTNLGTEKEDFVTLSQRIGSRTGGVWAHSLVSSHRTDPATVARFFVKGKAMVDQVDDLLSIMRDVLLTVRLDNQQRFLQMALEERAAEESGMVAGGHGVVDLRLRSQFDEAAWVSEQMDGISYLFFLRKLVEEVERDWPAVLARLERLHKCLVNRQTMLCNVTLAGADRSAFEPKLKALVSSLPEAPVERQTWTAECGARREGLVVPAPVNFVGKGANLYRLGYEMRGSVGVVVRYLRNTWLWDRVRVLGGAYGAFCSFDHFTGIIAFGSYRDPNLLGTIDVYDRSATYLRELDLSEGELTKAIIAAIGELDGYQLPDAKGYTSMIRQLTGVTDDFRQEMRDAVLGTTVEDFKAFGEALASVTEESEGVVVMGAREALEGVNREKGEEWLKLVPVL